MVIQKIKTAIDLLFSWVFYFTSHLIPRSSNIWICIGWHHNGKREVFADNAKYFFLHASKHNPRISVIWIAKDKILAKILRSNGYEAHSIHSIAGIYYSLRARYTFVDAFMLRENWKYVGGSKIVQLWHGKGLKKTGYDSPYSLKSRNQYYEPNLFVRFSHLIASSPYTAKMMASTFKAPLSDILITGLPRNDVLHKDIPGSDIDKHPKFHKLIDSLDSSNARIILYAPTFRPDGSNPMDHLDFLALNKYLKEHNEHFVISLHPKFARKDAIVAPMHSNIHFIEAGYDIYPLLKKIDVLVTDYSSIYVDFLLLDKPIIFFTYDLATYITDMGLHDDFLRLTPGPHVKTNTELISALTLPIDYTQNRASVREELFTYNDGGASARILNSIVLS